MKKIHIFYKFALKNRFFLLRNCLKKSKFFDPDPRLPRFQTRLTPLPTHDKDWSPTEWTLPGKNHHRMQARKTRQRRVLLFWTITDGFSNMRHRQRDTAGCISANDRMLFLRCVDVIRIYIHLI